MLSSGFDLENILLTLLPIALVIFSAILHEVAHGYMAYRLGDPTAKNAGRLTLNPAKHLDSFGSVILPIAMGLLGGPIFSYAKPVPYDPRNLRHPVRDEVLVAVAGPACNLLQAIVGAIVLRVGFGPVIQTTPAGAYLLTDSDAIFWAVRIVYDYVYVNLMLMCFNLIPLPPLDGSKVISPLFRGQARITYYKIQAYAMPILLIALYGIPMVFNVDPVGWFLDGAVNALMDVLVGF